VQKSEIFTTRTSWKWFFKAIWGNESRTAVTALGPNGCAASRSHAAAGAHFSRAASGSRAISSLAPQTRFKAQSPAPEIRLFAPPLSVPQSCVAVKVCPTHLQMLRMGSLTGPPERRSLAKGPNGAR
jgi:hypothetical protein